MRIAITLLFVNSLLGQIPVPGPLLGPGGGGGGGGGATAISGLTDSQVTRTSGTVLTIATGINVRGNTAVSVASSTATITAGSGNGTATVYITEGDVVTVEHPTAAGLTISCSGGCVAQQVTTPSTPANSRVLATVTVVSGAWTTVTDLRGLSSRPITCGTGLSCTDSGGVLTTAIDTADVPRLGAANAFTGSVDVSAGTLRQPSASGTPSSGSCDAAGEVGNVYVDTANGGSAYDCMQTGSSTYGWVARGGSSATISLPANAQTGTTYTILTGDRAKTVTLSNASAVAVTLPQAGGSFPDGWNVFLKNISAGTVTVTPTTSTISGAASITLETGEWALVRSDGTNYEAYQSRSVAGTGITVTKARTGATFAVDTATILSRATAQAGTSTYCRSTTGNDTYTCTVTPTLTAYTTGMCLVLNPDFANIGAATVNVDSLGAKSILLVGGLGLNDGDIQANYPNTICYDGTSMILQGVIPARGRNGLECYEPFFSTLVNAGPGGPCNLSTITTGGGTNVTSGEASAPGIQQLNTSTSATAVTALRTDYTTVLFGGGVWTYSARLRIPTLSDGTQRFHVQGGWMDANSATPTDGCYFRYKDDVNGGEWEGVCRSNSTESVVDTNIAPVANTWQILTIVVNAGATSVSFFIDGVSGGSITTNIPSGAGRQTGPQPGQITKTVGTTSRSVELDWVSYRFVQTTPN